MPVIVPSSHPGNQPVPLTLVTTELTLGGAEKCVVNLAIGLDKQKFTPSVVSLMPPPEDSKNELTERLGEANITVQFLNLRSGTGFPAAVWKLTQLLKRQNSRLAVSFLFHANSITSIARRLAGVLHHVGGIRVADPRVRRHWIERWLGRKVDKFVCVSKSVETFSHEVTGLPAGKLITIPNGIDLDRIDRIEETSLETAGVQSGRRAITFVGRLHEQKGLVDFLKHSKALLEQLPGHDLLLIGEGPLRSELESTIEMENLTDRVHLPGWRKDALGLLRASDLLVLPSRWEGMPNVVLEAMALSKPVVAFDVEGVEELLGKPQSDAGENQQVCDQGDFDGLIRRTTQIASNKQLMSNLGDENRGKIEQEFTLSSMIRAYENLFSRLIENPDNGGP